MPLLRQRSLPDLGDCSSSDSDCGSDDGCGQASPRHQALASTPGDSAAPQHNATGAGCNAWAPARTPAQAQLAALKAAVARAQARASGGPPCPLSPPLPPVAAATCSTPPAPAHCGGSHFSTTGSLFSQRTDPPGRYSSQASPTKRCGQGGRAPTAEAEPSASAWLQETPTAEAGDGAAAAAAGSGLTLQALLWVNGKCHWMVCLAALLAALQTPAHSFSVSAPHLPCHDLHSFEGSILTPASRSFSPHPVPAPPPRSTRPWVQSDPGA